MQFNSIQSNCPAPTQGLSFSTPHLFLLSTTDYAFGKCVPRFESDLDDLERDPLTESQSKILATMLQELQGAGLTWDHPFVQCRIQGALFALRERTPMPGDLCGHLAPPPEILGPQSPMAYVRFTQPEEDFLDDVFLAPPLKKAATER